MYIFGANYHAERKNPHITIKSVIRNLELYQESR